MKVPDHLKVFISGTLITIAGNVIFGLVNYLVRRVMALNLSENDYGCFYGAFALLSILLAFLDLGIVQAGTLLIAEDRKRNSETFSVIFLLKTGLGFFCALLILLCRDLIANSYLGGNGAGMLLLLAGYLFFQSMDGAFACYFSGRKFYRTANIFRALKSLLLLLLVFLSVKRFSFNGAAFSYLCSAAVFIPIQFFWIARKKSGGAQDNGTEEGEGEQRIRLCLHIPLDLWKRLIALIGLLAVLTFMQTLLFNMDSVMLTFLKGASATAVYNIALPVTQLLLAVLVFAYVMLPMAVEMVQKQNYARLKHYVRWGSLGTLLCLPILFYAARWTGPFLIGLLFDRKYAPEAAPLLPYLMTGYLLFSLGSFITQILVAMRKVKLLLSASLLTLLCNLSLNYLLIGRYGALGASVATALSYAFFSIFMLLGFFHCIGQDGKKRINA